jgi:hypothetical protein
VAENEGVAARGLEYAREDVEGGGLPRAIVTEQAEEGVVLDPDVDTVHGGEGLGPAAEV